MSLDPFRHECRDFLRFVARPCLAPRAAGRRLGVGGWADWFPGQPLVRVLQWAAALWLINIFFLGPIALVAAVLGGAEHKLGLSVSIEQFPWLQALLWAPVVEELVFRYGLRRPAQALWVVPACVMALLAGPGDFSMALVALVILACWRPLFKKPGRAGPVSRGLRLPRLMSPQTQQRYRRDALRGYRRLFPLVVHLSCLLFAAVHLNNFFLNQTPLWLMPLLVLPQWLTGLVLAWQRVRRGIGASMLLHGVFNGGPLLVVWVILQTLPDLAG